MMREVLSVMFLSVHASAGVIAIPSSVAPSLSVPTVVNSGLPASPLSLPVNTLPLIPLSLVPAQALAVAAATPSFPETPEPPAAVRHLNNFWDGLSIAIPEVDEPLSVAAPLAGVDDSIGGAPDRLAPWLETGDAKVASALDRAVAIARGTRAGRRALDAAKRTLEALGRTLPVLVLDLGRNHGEYDYLEKNMRLHSKLFQKGREIELAGTMVHELTHVAQHGRGVPSNALEMEIEAHLRDLEMLAEFGVKPPQGTFARQALDALARDPNKFIELISAAVPGSVFLGESSLAEIEEQLEEDLATQRKLVKRSQTAAGLITVIERDLASLRTAAGASSYRAFSKRVLALLRRRAAEAR